MVWSAFSSHGVLGLHRFQGNVTADSYIQVLDQHLLPFLEEHQNIQFQQDNARPHTANRTRQWFDDHRVDVMEWPACSPDLNPIENCWSRLKAELDKRIVHGMNGLFDEATQIWNQMPADFLQNLISSMPRRIEQVIQRQGRAADY